MTICSQCGSVYDISDSDIHRCKASEIPEKGKEISQSGIKRDLSK